MTLDSDTEQLVRRRMKERGVGFKEALNDLIREGVGAAARVKFRTKTASLGRPHVNLDRALQLAGEVEDDELVRRIRRGA